MASLDCRLALHVMLGGRKAIEVPRVKGTLDSIRHVTYVDCYDWEVYSQQLDPIAVLC